MKIVEVKENKKQYLDLLLLADEQEDMIDRYLDKGKMYVLDGNGVKCECVITDEGNNILEIKNTEVSENAVVAGETAGFEKRGGFQNRHVFRSHFGGVDHRQNASCAPGTSTHSCRYSTLPLPEMRQRRPFSQQTGRW